MLHEVNKEIQAGLSCLVISEPFLFALSRRARESRSLLAEWSSWFLLFSVFVGYQLSKVSRFYLPLVPFTYIHTYIYT